MKRFLRCLKHAWSDVRDTEQALPEDAAQRLARRIAASEQRHTGEVRICIEAGLPAFMAWRIDGPGGALRRVTRERAVQWFGQLGIWDTEHNNGVLIYLLLAERAIEIVADRGLARHVAAAEWQAIADRLGGRLRSGAFEEGLTQALEEVSALLMQHHAIARETSNPDELSNRVVRT